VLLVDDERLSRIVVGNLLRKCGYRGALAGLFVASPLPRNCL
jgi:CheY-like chemotaxis protein